MWQGLNLKGYSTDFTVMRCPTLPENHLYNVICGLEGALSISLEMWIFNHMITIGCMLGERP